MLIIFAYLLIGIAVLEGLLWRDRKVSFIDQWLDAEDEMEQVLVVIFWPAAIPTLGVYILYLGLKHLIKGVRIFFTTIVYLVAAIISNKKEEKKPEAQRANKKDKVMNRLGKSRLDKAKEIIKGHYKAASSGIFDCSNDSGDSVYIIYHDDEIEIDICYCYEYFEVFGLTDDEFADLEKYYEKLVEG